MEFRLNISAYRPLVYYTNTFGAGGSDADVRKWARDVKLHRINWDNYDEVLKSHFSQQYPRKKRIGHANCVVLST